MGVILGGNFLWWGLSRWELSGGNYLSGKFPVGGFIVPFIYKEKPWKDLDF